MYYWTPWATATMQVEFSGAQWSEAFFIVSCEQVLPLLLLQYSEQSWANDSFPLTLTSLGSLSGRKYETLRRHFLSRPGNCNGSQVKGGDVGDGWCLTGLMWWSQGSSASVFRRGSLYRGEFRFTTAGQTKYAQLPDGLHQRTEGEESQ